jgi:hypothetical protein
MPHSPQDIAMQSLEPLIGEWRMDVVFPSTSAAGGMDAGGVARFEYLRGRRFVIQRWEITNPDAPDGIAIIGWDGGRGSLVQHYLRLAWRDAAVRDELRLRPMEALAHDGRFLPA